MQSGELKKRINKIPVKPGIYMFTGQNKILYIGKASNLKNRVSSYLKTNDVRINKMLSLASDLKYKVADSDIEAMILESQMIKKHQPQFNIMLRDDKQYGFVGFTEEEFPKIFITHQPGSKFRNIDISNLIGPFTDIGALKTTLHLLRRIFPYCTCKQPHNNYCLNYHIGKCPGLCCLKKDVSSIMYYVLRDYKKNIRAIKGVLTGKKDKLIRRFEKEMKRLGKEQRFEEALELQNKIEKLKRVFQNARIIHNTKYIIQNTKTEKDSINILKQLAKIIGINRLPRRIEAYDIANIQGKFAVGAMVVFTLPQGSGQAEWKPDKNQYRRFKIRHIDTLKYRYISSGDTGMLKEVLSRRFNHREWPYPDLMLVDGGKGQLNAATKTIDNLQLTIDRKPIIVALTKDNKHHGSHIYIQSNVKSQMSKVELNSLSVSIKNLILRINNEAHQFAIYYYRSLHRKKIKTAD